MSVIAFDFYDEDDPNGSLLGTLDETVCKSMEFRVALHEMGSGQFTISRHSASASATLIRENNLVKVRIPSVSNDPIFAFWLKEGQFTLIDSNEQGGEDLTFGGPGVIYILALSRLPTTPYAPGQPARGSLDELGHWTWINEPYGAILTRVIEEGQNQPGTPLADVTIDFDRVDDSDSVAWPTITEKFQTPIGSGLMDVVQRLAAAGDLYLIPEPDLTIHAYQTYGRTLTGSFGSSTVRFEKGVNILTQMVRTIEAREVLTHLIQQDSDGNYSTEVIAGYGGGRAHYGYHEVGQTNDDTQLNKIGQHVLSASSTHGQSLELECAPGFDPTNGLYMPGPDGTNGHFWVGDKVTVHTGSGDHDFNAATQTVVAIRVVLDPAADDTDSTTSARSLHIVPELNYLEVRKFTGVSPAALGQPGYCCGPSPATPGTPGTEVPPTIDYTWPFTSDLYDVEEHLHRWLGATTYESPGAKFNWTGTAFVSVLATTSPANSRSVTPGVDYTLLINVTSRTGGAGTRRLEFIWYNSANGTISTHVLSSDLGAGNHVFSVPTAPTGAAGFRIQCLSSGTADLIVSYIALRHGGSVSGGTGGDGNPDLVGTCTTNYAGCDHTHEVIRDRAPTVDDDMATEGYPVTTIWTQVNDINNPTTIVAAWVLVDSTTGAAVWLPLATAAAVDTLDGRIDALEDSTPDAVAEAKRTFHGRFLATYHRASDTVPLLMASDDGITWSDVGEALLGTTTMRDPSIMHWDGVWWLCGTIGAAGATTIYKSTDLVTWSSVVTLTSIGGGNRAWAPEWIRNMDGTPYIHPSTGFPAVTINISTDAETTFTVREMHPTNRGMTTWSSTTTITGTGLPTKMIDGYLLVDGTDYYLWYKDEVSTERHIEIAHSSTSLTSGYTVLEGGDWAGWFAAKDSGANSTEGAAVVRLDDGRWRVYFNENNGLNSIRTVYSETTDDWRTGTSTWTTQAEITTDALMAHGTIIRAPSVLDHLAQAHSSESVGALDDLSDVTITAPDTGDMLRYDGSAWVNTPGRWEPVTTNPGGGPELVWDGDELLMTWVNT